MLPPQSGHRNGVEPMTQLDRTARFFRQRRRRWISALAVMKVGGLLRWRTSISECRTRLGMDIKNKVERTPRGARSYYRYIGKKVA